MTESKDLLLNGANGAAPDYMQGVGDDEFGGGMDGSGYPRLAFKLARFRLRQGDEEIVMPNNSIEVIVLKDYPAISRIFFDSSFDSSGEEDNRPACASADGEHPVSTIAAPQNSICATCPQNQKGSRITDDGSKTRACGFYKRLVVLIKGFEDVGPVVTDIKAMSIFGDSKSGDNLWTLKAYFARLKSNDVLPSQLWTEMTFDTDESVPKVLFRPLSYVEKPMFLDTVAPLIATPDGKQLMLDMADTSKVRIEGEDGEAQMALPPGEKPAHLTAPEPEQKEASTSDRAAELGKQLNFAIEQQNFTDAAAIKAEIEALTDDTPAETQPTEPVPTVQEVVDGMKRDLQTAIDASDYVKAGQIQEDMVKYIEDNKAAPKQEAKPTKPASPAAEVDSTGATWNPEIHATSGKTKKGIINADGTWRARKGVKAQPAKPAAKPEPTPEIPTGNSETGFDDELDSALKDFGF